MRITEKGQVTIPQAIREQAGLMPGTEVSFELVAGEVHLHKVRGKASKASRGEKLVEALRGTGRYAMSTDEIVALMRGDSVEREMAEKSER